MGTSVVIIDPDNRQSYVMIRQLRDSHPGFVYDTFTSVRAYRKKYIENPGNPGESETDPQPAPAPEQTGEGGGAYAAIEPISLFIVSIDAITGNINEFAQSLLEEASLKKLWKAPDAPPRIILLDYESDAKPITAFQYPMISDLVYKPIDWQLFSQKMDIALGVSKGQSTHIYAQDVEFHVKIAKDSVVEQLSDFGFVMRGASNVPPSSFGYFYFPSQLDPGRLGLVARCLFSRPHPEFKGMFQVYFSFFGLSEVMRQAVRDIMVQGKRGGLKFDSTFDRMMQDYQTRIAPQPRNFIIIEMNPKHRETIRSLLQENFQDTNVFECASYQDFLRDFLDVGKKAKPALDLTTPLCTDCGDQLKITVSIADLAIQSINPQPAGGTQICGYDASQFMKDKKYWLTLMGADDRQRLNELSAYVRSGEATETVIDMQAATGKRKAVKVRAAGVSGKASQASTVELELADITKDKIREAMESDDRKLNRIDGIFLAGEFVGKESSAWLDALRKKLVLKGMVPPKVRLPFIIFFNEDIEKTPEDYKDYGFDEFVYRPIDRAQLLKRMRLHFPFLKCKPNVSIALEFMSQQMQVYVARDVLLEQVSEYGIKIRYAKPMGDGSYFTLFHPIFVDDQDNIMHIRSYFDREHPIHKGFFESYFSFFGVRDSFLKKIRRWIREHYAAKATKSEG